MLEINDLCVDYCGLRALSKASLRVEDGQFVAIVGANGAGKTTLFKAISGIVSAGSGSIQFDGHNLIKLTADERPHLGIAHVPEGRQIFSSLSVMENLELGAYTTVGQANWKISLEFILGLFPDSLGATETGGGDPLRWSTTNVGNRSRIWQHSHECFFGRTVNGSCPSFGGRYF